ncbi:MAG: hypothetical protein R2684_00740 [Pyrinomonadaceae bacterium]
MKNSTKNSLFRSTLLLLNIALIGSIALDGKTLKTSGKSKSEPKAQASSENQTPIVGERIVMPKGINLELTPGSVKVANQSTQVNERTLEDGTKLTVMPDGSGGTQVLRFFPGDKRLRFVSIQTAPGGDQKIFVHGRTGKVGTVPSKLGERILVASADEIADAARIYLEPSAKEEKRLRVEAARLDLKRQAQIDMDRRERERELLRQQMESNRPEAPEVEDQESEDQ